MNSDERNTGNAARSDTQVVWNGLRSVRMDAVQVDPRKMPAYQRGAQRNVLWQAIHADAFVGKRVVFRPYLRATPGDASVLSCDRGMA